MLPGRTPRRHGLSLLEIIVVLGLLLFLAAALLPFLFRIREASARTQGLNNLHQISIGWHSYHDNHRRMPPIAGVDPAGRPGSVLFHLLPYIEQNDVHRQGSVWQSGAIGMPVPLFVAPADRQAPPGNKYEGAFATTNYAANWLAFRDGNRRIANFTDGTSNTIAFAERYQVCNQTPCVWGYDRVYYWAPVFAYYSQGKFQTLPKVSDCDPAVPQALEASGLQIGLGDGSARLLRHSVSPQTWHAAITPDGGEILGPDFEND